MPNPTDNALIASSQFDPTTMIAGIAKIGDSVDQLIAKETLLQKQLDASTKALADNQAQLKANQSQIDTLDKSAGNYQSTLSDLTTQHRELGKQASALQDTVKQQQAQLTQVGKTADDYKNALTNLTATAKQFGVSTENLFDPGKLTKQVQQVTGVANKFRNIFQGKLDNSALDDLEHKLASSKEDFAQFKQVIDDVKAKLQGLKPGDAGFEELSKAAATGEEVLNHFSDVQNRVAKNGPGVRQQLREMKNELAGMAASGEEGTQKFKDLSEQAAILQHAVDKTGERVRVFASDTRLIEGGVEAIRGLAAGFELAAGASALFGVDQGAAEESIKRLNAIMAIANGLQEVSNLLKKESALRLLTEDVATKAYTITQRVLAVTLGTTAAASKGLAATLAATGIGALVIAIGFLISALSKWADETKEQTREQENLNYALEGTLHLNDEIAKDLQADDALFAQHVKNLQTSQRLVTQNDRERQKQQQDQAIETQKTQEDILRGQLEFQTLVVQQLDKASLDAFQKLDDIKRLGLKTSAEQLEALHKTVDLYNQAEQKRQDLENKLTLLVAAGEGQRREISKQRQQQALDDAIAFGNKLVELQRGLKQAQDRAGRADEAEIRREAGLDLAKNLREIDQEVAKGSLTGNRGRILKNILRQINEVDLAKELKDFNKKVVEAEASLANELNNLQNEEAQTRIGLLRDSLEQQAAQIRLDQTKELQKLTEDRREALKGVQDAFEAGLITEQAAQANAAKIEAVYDQMFQSLADTTDRKFEELARASFERSQQLVEILFAPALNKVDIETQQALVRLYARYQRGAITFQKLQEEITDVQRKESLKRIELQKVEDQQLLLGVQNRLKLEKDPKQREALVKQEQDLQRTLAELDAQAAETRTAQQHDDFQRKLKDVTDYASAIGNITASVVAFWQAQNDAEQKALDRSIAIQERRVEYATKIAERGNASYLRLEQDRLNALRLQQENAARRQLAINAVLQGSQALVAFTSALAQGISTGGPLGGIAIAAAVIGLLASGYSIIKQLQASQNQATTQGFARGERRVRRGPGEKPGVDTVHAMLTEDEAVVNKPMAKAFGPTLDAMFNDEVPAQALNQFVQNYHVTRGTPVLNYDKIGAATDFHVNYDGKLVAASHEMAQQLRESNEKLDRMDQHLQNLGVFVRLDENGLAVATQRRIDHNKKQRNV